MVATEVVKKAVAVLGTVETAVSVGTTSFAGTEMISAAVANIMDKTAE